MMFADRVVISFSWSIFSPKTWLMQISDEILLKRVYIENLKGGNFFRRQQSVHPTPEAVANIPIFTRRHFRSS